MTYVFFGKDLRACQEEAAKRKLADHKFIVVVAETLGEAMRIVDPQKAPTAEFIRIGT